MSIISEAYEELNHFDADYPVRCSYQRQNFSFPPHYHRGIEIVYVADGIMNLQVNNQPYKLTEGDLLIIGSHHIHSYLAVDSGKIPSYYLLIFDWQHLKDINEPSRFNDLAPVLLQTNLVATKDATELNQAIETALNTLNREHQGSALGKELMVLSQLYKLLTLSGRHLQSKGAPSGNNRQLQKSYDTLRRLNRLIYNEFTREITLAEAAEVTGYSPYHFTRVFRNLTGTTFKAYLNEFRINMVKNALRSTDLPITDLALTHGYSSLKTFNRNFLKSTGMTPSEYRKSNF